jgi:hypothetical protein
MIQSTNEAVEVKALHNPVTINSTTATYGAWVDTRDYDSAAIVLNVGQIAGESTLTATVYEKDSASGSGFAGDTGAVAVTGASITATRASGQQSVKIGNILTKNYKRYLALRISATTSNSANPTIGAAAEIVLSSADKNPTSQTATFDVEG